MDTKHILPTIVERLNQHKNRLLQIAAIGMTESQFRAYRTIVLDELGRNGFERDLEEILKQHMERNGTGRPIHAGKEVPK